jgi:hypothetical protein
MFTDSSSHPTSLILNINSVEIRFNRSPILSSFGVYFIPWLTSCHNGFTVFNTGGNNLVRLHYTDLHPCSTQLWLVSTLNSTHKFFYTLKVWATEFSLPGPALLFSYSIGASYRYYIFWYPNSFHISFWPPILVKIHHPIPVSNALFIRSWLSLCQRQEVVLVFPNARHNNSLVLEAHKNFIDRPFINTFRESV